MARRRSYTRQSVEPDDDTYSGYNDLIPALATADIREHGLRVLSRSYSSPGGNYGSFSAKQDTPRPRPFRPLDEESVDDGDFGYDVRTRSVSRCASLETNPSHPLDETTPRPRSGYCPPFLANTPRSNRQHTLREGTSTFSTSTPRPSSRSRNTHRLGWYYSRGATATSRPSTPLGRPLSSIVGTPRKLTTTTAACYFNDRQGTAMTNCRRSTQSSGTPSKPFTAPPLEGKVPTEVEQMWSLQLQLSELLLACRQAESPQHALEIAKEAQARERQLYTIYDRQPRRFLHDKELMWFPYNTGLTFAVIMNLAWQYEANRMYKEALNTYRIVERSSSEVFSQLYRVKINMGNMYVKLCQYPLAIKTYRKALDQAPQEFRCLRVRILRNLGVIFFKTNQLKDAIAAFTSIMEEQPGFVEGMNLMVCLYALGSKEDMKICFEMLLNVPLESESEEPITQWEDKDKLEVTLLNDDIKNSSLHKLLQKRKFEADRVILMSARLVAVSICDSVFDGYDWCIEAMKDSQFSYLVGEIQIAKGTKLLNEGRLEAAIEVYENLLPGGGSVGSAAATNLAFIYLTQGDVEAADRLSEVACREDAYSSPALVNAACCCLARGDNSTAKDRLAAAVDNDALCFEGLYNLGLANKRLGLHDEASSCFLKLRTMFQDDRLVQYHLASLAELTGDVDTAITRYQQLICIEPRNALASKKLGDLHKSIGDEVQAHHYYLDSYRSLPSQMDVLTWLGNYYLKLRCPEEATKYFNLAIQCKPNEIKWHLMVAACYRRCGDLTRASEYYEEIHKLFPDDAESLSYLVKLYLPVDKEKAKSYAAALKKLEKSKRLHKPNTSVPQSANSSTSSRIVDNSYLQTANNCTALCNYTDVLTDYIPSRQPPFPKLTDSICTLDNSHQDKSNHYRYELLPTCIYDNEIGMNNSRGGLDTRCTSCVSYCPGSTGSLEQSCQSLLDKSHRLPHRGSILPNKVDVYTLFRSAQVVSSDPTCSARDRFDCQETRMVFTRIGEDSYAPMLMRIGDSMDRAQGQCCSTCISTTTTTPHLSRAASRESCSLGLKIFPENELGSDLLPN